MTLFVNNSKKVFRAIAISCVALLLLASTGSAAPAPNPMVYEVKDSNGSMVQVLVSSLLGRERTYVYNVQWGTGFRLPSPNSMVNRILSDVAYYRPQAVLIELGTVDTQSPEGYNNYMAVIDQIMTRVTVPVVWLQVPLQNLPGTTYTVEGANAINSALQQAEATYPNLWALPTQTIWDQAYSGQCPQANPGNIQMLALSECFDNLGADVHYNINGHFAVGIVEDAAIELAIAGQSRNNSALVSSVQDLLAAIDAS